MKPSLKIIIALSLCFVVLVNAAKAQDPKDEAPIKVNTFLVNIPVIVSDRDGRYISGLTKENFTILQDGEKQPVEFFADEKAPMNVAILIDTSGSTKPFLVDIQNAALDFIKVFRPEDRALIAGFNFETNILSEFTSDQDRLRRAIRRTGISAIEGSDMQDAVYQLVTEDFAAIKGRKAIVVLTDGLVVGRISDEKLLSLLAESDVLVYPILFRMGKKTAGRDFPKTVTLPNGKTITGEEALKIAENFEKYQMVFMNSLATATGGRVYTNDSNNFKNIFQNIAAELKNQYLIGFYAQNADDGKPHQIAVEVSPKDYIIRTKRKTQLKFPN